MKTRSQTRKREQPVTGRSKRAQPKKSTVVNPRRPAPAPSLSPSLSPSSTPDYSNTTDPKKVDRPVEDDVHSALSLSWKVNRDLEMWFVFDTISPARLFKRGAVRNDEDDFADYDTYEELTETDGDPPGWMQYKPPIY